jgi:hypothetical protein
MTRTDRLAICLLVTVATCGCDRQTLTGPTPTAPVTSATSPQLDALHVVGLVVDSANSPVAGARVTPWSDPTHTQISDARGTFDMTVPVTAQDRWFWITVEKAGYETSELARNVDTAATTSLRLHQIRSIAAGESLQLVVNPDDSACGYHWGFVCRRVQVTSASSGTLVLEVVSAFRLGIPVGPTGFPQTLQRRVSVPVNVGSVISVDVAGSLEESAEFTLNTSLTPAS